MKQRLPFSTVGLMLLLLLGAACSQAPAATPTLPATAVPPTAVPPTDVPPAATKASTVVTPTSAPAQVSNSSADPFSYCTTVGTVDAPDSRWTGPKVPEVISRGLMKTMGVAADMPIEVFAQGTSWRCMNKQVYACNVGANIPCGEKAETSRTPTAAMNDYCKANPKSDHIPASVTGRATVYDWKCVSGKPTVNKQITQPDARGFLAAYWYLIKN